MNRQGGRRALHFTPAGEGSVRCDLCPTRCLIPPGGRGLCRVRENREGELVATTYGLASSLALDPVEKKPLYHFHPGSTVLSVGSVGCNMRCRFCQNWRIAHSDAHLIPVTPRDLVRRAVRAARRDCIGLAYTYNEPLVWYEFVLETCRRVREAGLKNILVTNAFCNPGPWESLLELVDAVNVDVKGMDELYYRDMCRGEPAPVLDAVRVAHGLGVHVEITNLLVTGENDGEEDVERLALWLSDLSPDIALHLTRYFPNYQLDHPPTPFDALRRARDVAARHLRFVYLGNAWPSEGSDTLCHHCGRAVIARSGYSVDHRGLRGGRCAGCGASIPIVTA